MNSSKIAICLFSGGLDSMLAAKLMLKQGVKLTALHFHSVFTDNEEEGKPSRIEHISKLWGMDFLPVEITEKMLKLVKSPSHGYGSVMNPCIDCRILQLRLAKKIMREREASFIVTGEVMGQRPMTQKKNMMRHIEKEGKVGDILLRPLSAQLLPPTLPEREGWVDRSRLLNFSGRTRKPQMRLAQEMGIKNYPAPAGGCRLTDPGYGRRLKDLLTHAHQIEVSDLNLLTSGRHFRLDKDTKIVVGRDEIENKKLESIAGKYDTLFECTNFPGPTTLLRGDKSEDNLLTAARLTLRYGKAVNLKKAEVQTRRQNQTQTRLVVQPASPDEFSDLMI